jgi:hypothetical protein
MDNLKRARVERKVFNARFRNKILILKRSQGGALLQPCAKWFVCNALEMFSKISFA